MSSVASKHTDFGSKDSLKKKWLSSLGLADDKSVIDCDCSAQTVTFQTDDGPLVRQVVECWTRVMGYHRPVSSFNIGKQGEHRERKAFREQPAKEQA
jgi:hypothetical protein